MPRTKTDTEEYVSALSAGLVNFFDPGDKLAASLPQHHEALPVYSLGLKEFPPEAAEKLPELRQVGWRFIGTGPASGLGCHVGGEPVRLTGVARAQEIAYLLDCFRQLKELRGAPDGLSEQEYELRSLRIPGLLIEAFWVYCAGDEYKDYIVPIAGILAGSIASEAGRDPIKWNLKPMQFYSAKAFFREVREPARRKLRMHAELYAPHNVGPPQRRVGPSSTTATASAAKRQRKRG
jgi:hypothetical protein